MSDTQPPEAFKAIHIEPLRDEEKLPPDPALPVVDAPAPLARIEIAALQLDPGEEPPKSWIAQLRDLAQEGMHKLPGAHATALLAASQAFSPRTTIILGQLRPLPALNPEIAGAYVWRRALALVEEELAAATSPENLRAQLLLMGITPDRVTADVLRVAVSWGQRGLPVEEILRRLERISEADMARELWAIDNTIPAKPLPGAVIEEAPDTARPEALSLEEQSRGVAVGASTYGQVQGSLREQLVLEREPDERGAVDAGREREEGPASPREKSPERTRHEAGALYDSFLVLAEYFGVLPGQLPRLAELPSPFPSVWASLAAVLQRVDRLGRETYCASWLARVDQETEGFVADATLSPGKPEPGIILPTAAGDGGLSLTWEETQEQPTWNALAQRYSERLFQAELGRKGAKDELARWRDATEVETVDDLARALSENRAERSKLGRENAGLRATISDLDAEVMRLRALERAQTAKIGELEAEVAIRRAAQREQAGKIRKQGIALEHLRAQRPLGAPEAVTPYQGDNPFLLTLNGESLTWQIGQLRQRVIDTDLCADALHRKLGLTKPLGFAGVAEHAAVEMDRLNAETEGVRLRVRAAHLRLAALRSFLIAVCAETFRTMAEVTAAAGKAFTDDVAHDMPAHLRDKPLLAGKRTQKRLVDAIKGRSLDPASTSRSGGVASVAVDLRVTLSPLELIGMALGGELVEHAKVRTEHDPGAVSLRERSAVVVWPWWVPRFGTRPSIR